MILPLHPVRWRAELATRPGPALLVFTQKGCGACAALTRVLNQPWASPPGLTVWSMDAHEASAAVAELDVFHLPTMFLFVDGAFHAAVDCAPTARGVADAVHAALAGPAQDEP